MIYPLDWKIVTCHDWYETENKIWMCLENKNAICEIDKNSRALKILGSFPHNGLGERDLSLSVGKYDDYILFCPFKANDIAILNVKTGKLEFVELLQILEKYNYISSGTEKFYRMFFYENYVYFLGIKYPVIMKFNILTKKIELFDDWLNEIEKHKCKDAVLFTDGYAQKGNEIYLPIGRCNGMLRINLDSMEWKYIGIKSVTHGILGMTQKEQFVWFTEYDINAEKFFQWNLDRDEIIEIKLPYKDSFYAPLYCNESLFFFENYGKKSCQYELGTGKWRDITNVLIELKYSSDKKVQKDEIHYFANRSKKFYHWNFKKNVINYDEIKIDDEEFLEKSWLDYCKYYKQELKEHVIQEDKLTIKDYIKIIGTNQK